MPTKITWTVLFKVAIVAALIQPFLIAVAFISLDQGVTEGGLFSAANREVFTPLYILYLARIAVPWIIYAISPSNRTRGMLTYGLKTCFLIEIFIVLECLNAIAQSSSYEGFESLGPLFITIGSITLSVIAQLIGMIYGAIRGFERTVKA